MKHDHFSWSFVKEFERGAHLPIEALYFVITALLKTTKCELHSLRVIVDAGQFASLLHDCLHCTYLRWVGLISESPSQQFDVGVAAFNVHSHMTTDY